nr:hypothetical protein [Tanacetum cinerariifolium]
MHGRVLLWKQVVFLNKETMLLLKEKHPILSQRKGGRGKDVKEKESLLGGDPDVVINSGSVAINVVMSDLHDVDDQHPKLDGIEAMLESGPWLIRNVPLILKKWTPDANIMKEDVSNIPVWVKFHDLPVTAFTEDGLSAIATKLSNPLVLDSYTAAMCIDSWGRASYTRAMVELKADVELRDTIAPPRCLGCKVFGHVLDACPKKIASDISNKSKMPRQLARGSPVGLKPKSNFVYRPFSNKKTAKANGNPKVQTANKATTPTLNSFDALMDDHGKLLKMEVTNKASASKPSNSMEDQLYQPTTFGDVFLLARTIEARFDDQAASVAGTSAGLEANKVVNDGDVSESSESTSDNDARDQAGELETKMLVDGKQDEAKMVVLADEQKSDELLKGNRVIAEKFAQNQQDFLDEYLPQWDDQLATRKQRSELEWENPFAAKRGENHTVLHISKNEKKDDDLPYPKFRKFQQQAAQIIKKHEEHAFPTAADDA